MSLAASIQITDQDVYTLASVQGAEALGQLASAPSGRVFAYAQNGAVALAAGKITSPVNVTANYVTRTLTATATAAGSTQISIPLGTTASADAFKNYNFVVTDATGKGQGAYTVTGNTAATAGNSNTTVVTIKGQLNVALDNTSVVGLYPNQESAVIITDHTAAPAVPVSGAPIIAVTASYFFWNQVQGYASILSDDTSVVTKNAGGIPSNTVDGAVEIEVTGTVTQRIGYAPELMVANKYSPFVLTLTGL
jgi:hypothetical protein